MLESNQPTTGPLQAKGTENWAFFVPSSFQSAVNKWLTWKTNPGSVRPMNLFAAGEVMYDTPKAYQIWSSALKHIKEAISIDEVVADKVKFTLSASDGVKLLPARTYTLYIDEFMSFLESGKILD